MSKDKKTFYFITIQEKGKKKVYVNVFPDQSEAEKSLKLIKENREPVTPYAMYPTFLKDLDEAEVWIEKGEL